MLVTVSRLTKELEEVKTMAKKRKKEKVESQNGVKALPLYDLVKEKNGNVHPDYCFYHIEWDEEVGMNKKIVHKVESGVCKKINLDTLCCIPYPNPTTVIKPHNPLLGCPFSPVELNKNKVETVIKINPIKASKRARRMMK
jgi:hypothetical protein